MRPSICLHAGEQRSLFGCASIRGHTGYGSWADLSASAAALAISSFSVVAASSVCSRATSVLRMPSSSGAASCTDTVIVSGQWHTCMRSVMHGRSGKLGILQGQQAVCKEWYVQAKEISACVSAGSDASVVICSELAMRRSMRASLLPLASLPSSFSLLSSFACEKLRFLGFEQVRAGPCRSGRGHFWA